MRYPVNYIGIAQPFGKHKGVDFGWNTKHGGKNQPVYAVDDGVVIYNRHQITGGYVIHIRHNNGTVSEYGHLKKNSQRVHEGDKVKKGQEIALMGGSGIVTGNHLHFGLYKGTSINYKDKSKFIDPLKYLCCYDNQVVGSTTAKKYKIYHTKKVTAKDDLNVRTGPSVDYPVIYVAKFNSEVESFGLKDKWNIVDNLRKYYCSNNYLKK